MIGYETTPTGQKLCLGDNLKIGKMKQYGRQKMKGLSVLMLLLGLCLSNMLVAQSIEDGTKYYKDANVARAIGGDEHSEKVALEKAYQIFKGFASEKNSQALVMYYILAVKLGEKFYQQDLLDIYVKNEHPDYRTIESIQFYGDDKVVLLDKLRKLADQNREEAVNLLTKAKAHEAKGDYEDAMDKLLAAEKLWKIDEINDLKTKYDRLKKKQNEEVLIARIRQLGNQSQYQEALKTIEEATNSLDATQMATLKGEIIESWSKKLLDEAQNDFRAADYNGALTKSQESNRLLPSNEASTLIRKAENKIAKQDKKKYSNSKSFKPKFSIFADIGYVGNLKMESMNYSFSGNSTSYVTLADMGTLSAQPVKGTEENPKISLGFSGGLLLMLSSKIGISASVSSIAKQELNILSDYTFSWRWSDGRNSSRNALFTDSGTLSAIPVSLNLYLLLNAGRSTNVALYAGPTYFMSKPNLNTRIGLGIVGLKNDGYNYVDWFPFEYQIKNNQAIWGGNAGVDIELGGKHTGLYLGAQYFYAPAKEYQWNLISKRYEGQLGYFYINNPAQWSPLPNYKSKINFSTFKIHLGVKLSM